MIEKKSENPPSKTVKSLFNKIEDAFDSQDGNTLYSLFKQLYNDPAFNTSVDRWNTSIDFRSYSNTQLGTAFGKLLQLIRQFHIEKLKKGINFAFKNHLNTLSQVIKILELLQDQQNIWICKPMRQIIRNTKKIFMSGLKKDQQNFGIPQVRKDDMIIKLNQFRTRRELKEPVRQQIFPLIDNMQISIMLESHSYDQITKNFSDKRAFYNQATIDNHYFQNGKLALIYENFKTAERWFEKINIKTKKQDRLVLKYLIPCKMFLGKPFVFDPSVPQHHFPEYEPLIKALDSANFKDYNEAFKKFQKVWIKRGIYLLMDKLKIILWRNLIRKIYKILQEDKLQMDLIQKAVIMSGGNEKVEECICIISNLIYEKYLQGYIYQNETHRYLVLKKGGAGFTKLTDIKQPNQR